MSNKRKIEDNNIYSSITIKAKNNIPLTSTEKEWLIDMILDDLAEQLTSDSDEAVCLYALEKGIII
jgi:hypothetical protein